MKLPVKSKTGSLHEWVSKICPQEQEVTHGGSIPGHIVIHRDREIADRNLFNDYFTDNPRYNEAMFRRRFRMSRNIFLRIVDEVKNHDIYFTQRSDSVGCLGLSTIQKTTAALRILAYALPADATDEYIKIGESTAIQCMQRFCRAVVEVFAEQYLRSPTADDVARLLYIGKQRGFPGMLGRGRSGSPTIILEVVADYDLWIWHAYFGMPGSNNDINVLGSSNLFFNIAQGIAPRAHYTIFPKWSTIVQSIHDPHGPKKKYFAMKQESCRKDVERAFGVLQSRFAIVASPADMREAPTPDVEMVIDENIRFQEFLARYKKIKDKNAHYALRNALIDHLWEEYSCSNV
ncbi:uncharacterized protein LOC142544402 [Primulina tabacum]|uniref:uncharacterized protein LOC142544402 n=1 Tax=Primulina tabacum TaxID=48773 RepID=UPI003F5A234D